MIPSPRETQSEDSPETEGARSATGVTGEEAPSRPRLARQVPDPEVPAKAQRRKFTAEYKLRILLLMKAGAQKRKCRPPLGPNSPLELDPLCYGGLLVRNKDADCRRRWFQLPPGTPAVSS